MWLLKKDSEFSSKRFSIVTHGMFGNVYIFISLVTSISHVNIDLNVCAFRSLNTNLFKCNCYVLILIELNSNSSLQILNTSTRFTDGHTSVMSELC